MAQPTDKTNKEQTQKRILIATVLSFAFFIAYDFLYLQPKQDLVNQANAQNAVTMENKSIGTIGTNSAPAATTNSAPSIAEKTVTNTAPAIVSTTNVIATIETLKNTRD